MCVGAGQVMNDTYGLAADVGMPDFGVEFHDGRAEWVLGWDADVDDKAASLVRRARRAGNAGLEVRQVAGLGGLGRDLAAGVGFDVGQLFGDAPGTTGGGHGG